MGGRGFRMYGKVVWPGLSGAPPPRRTAKVGRNDPCPCGSGRKYKDCHEGRGESYLERLAREEDRRHQKELRARLKEQGVPWYKRLFFRSR